MAEFADYYREIYARGLGGETPSIPVAVEEQERRAHEAMDERARQLRLRRGGQRGHDARQPRGLRALPHRAADAARRRRARPLDRAARHARCRRRCCWRRSACRRSSTRTASWPAPGRRRRSACRWSPAPPSHFTLEEIAEAGGDAPRWFQLYWPNDRDLPTSFVGRAEAAGYEAIVLTVDTFVPGWKPRDLQQAWLPFLKGMGIANYFHDPVFRAALEMPPEEDLGRGLRPLPRRATPIPRLTWDDLAWLREQTSLPILLKGILHPDDAREAVRARHRRDRRLQPRRPPGRRRDRFARRPAGDRRGGRRSSSRSSSTAASAAAPTSSRRSRSAPTRSCSAALPLGTGARRPGRRRDGAEDAARRARPDAGASRPHRVRASSAPRRWHLDLDPSHPDAEPVTAHHRRARGCPHRGGVPRHGECRPPRDGKGVLAQGGASLRAPARRQRSPLRTSSLVPRDIRCGPRSRL